MAKTKKSKARGKRGIPSRDYLYHKLALASEEAIEVVKEIMRGEGNIRTAGMRLGAAKVILSRTVPELKVQEISGDLELRVGVVVLPTPNEATNPGTSDMASPPGTPDQSPSEN